MIHVNMIPKLQELSLSELHFRGSVVEVDCSSLLKAGKQKLGTLVLEKLIRKLKVWKPLTL